METNLPEETKAKEEVKQSEDSKPKEEVKTSEDSKPLEQEKPKEEPKPLEQEKPKEESKPLEQEKPKEEPKSEEELKKEAEQLNQLKNLLYPEALEQYSKVTSILSDDFSFKFENLLTLKDVQKFISDEATLIKLLKKIAEEPKTFLILDENKKEGKITIGDMYIEYSFVNFPFNYDEKKVIETLKLKEGDYSRLYKQSLFWILVSENQKFIEGFEDFIKTIKIEDSPLKCNMTSGIMLKKVISKSIMNYTLKEANDLNVLSKRKESNASQSSKGKGEEMSWRKKSDDDTLEVEKLGKGKNKGKYNKRRERFKSDPMDWNPTRRNIVEQRQGKNKNKFELAFAGYENRFFINPQSVRYPLDIRFKYSNKEIVECFTKIKDSIGYDPSIFKYDIPDVITKDMKNLIVSEKDNLKAEIPKNNPLLNFKGNK